MVKKIPHSEFEERIRQIQVKMDIEDLDVLFVYGDEYWMDNVRYLVNYWPQFERTAVILPCEGEPIVLCAPEGEFYAKEMSQFPDVRSVEDFIWSGVSSIIEYPQAVITSFGEIINELSAKQKVKKIGVVGLEALPVKVYENMQKAFQGIKLVDARHILSAMRLIKSENEIKMLEKAGKITDEGFKALEENIIPGEPEYKAAAAAEYTIRSRGAEGFGYGTIVCSGIRSNTVLGRSTDKIFREGEIVLAGVGARYQGYVASVARPLVVGKKPTSLQEDFIHAIAEAERLALAKLGPGSNGQEINRIVQNYFEKKGYAKYILYGVGHGAGLLECEDPYLSPNADVVIQPGMVINLDVGLFEHPKIGSARLEEGFVISETGVRPLSKYIRDLYE